VFGLRKIYESKKRNLGKINRSNKNKATWQKMKSATREKCKQGLPMANAIGGGRPSSEKPKA
jgi:hypothetical protein